ncbi:MAG: hypothetical protein K0Q71_3814 [Thermomicrobiales bacterium]|jgi:hypothetical protein|nr:hypothetical protein [Thermomicrobiales bacterium]
MAMPSDGALHAVARELALAAQATRLGRPAEVDGLALAAAVDQELARFLAARRGQVLQSLSHRTSKVAGMVSGLEAGMTTDDPATCALELAAVASGLRILAALSAAPKAA